MSEEQRHLKVFLCYAHNDKSAVIELYQHLNRDGIDAWLDRKKLLPGQELEWEIRKAVHMADVVIICLSRQFDHTGLWHKEMKLVLDVAMEKPEGKIFIIPLRLEECDVPLSLRRWQWVDFFEEDGYNRLLQALQKRAEDTGAISQRLIQKQGTWRRRVTKFKNRVLEAAIENQVSVGLPTSVFVWIKRTGSKSIVSVVRSVNGDTVFVEDDVSPKEVEVEFPIKNGQITPASVSLRLIAHNFTPFIQQKEILVPSEGDSQVCTFIVIPNKTGKLSLNLEVVKDNVCIASRLIYTTAIEGEKKGPSSMIVAAIPIVIFVHSGSIRDNFEYQQTLQKVSEEPKSPVFKWSEYVQKGYFLILFVSGILGILILGKLAERPAKQPTPTLIFTQVAIKTETPTKTQMLAPSSLPAVSTSTTTPIALDVFTPTALSSSVVGKWILYENPACGWSDNYLFYQVNFGQDWLYTTGPKFSAQKETNVGSQAGSVTTGSWSLTGDEITLISGKKKYVGKLDGDTIKQGIVYYIDSTGPRLCWTAKKND